MQFNCHLRNSEIKYNRVKKSALYFKIAKLQNKIYHVIAASSSRKYTRKTGLLVAFCKFSYEFLEEINKAAAGQTPNKRIMLMITLNLKNNKTPLFKDTSTITQQKNRELQAADRYMKITKNNRESCVWCQAQFAEGLDQTAENSGPYSPQSPV